MKTKTIASFLIVLVFLQSVIFCQTELPENETIGWYQGENKSDQINYQLAQISNSSDTIVKIRELPVIPSTGVWQDYFLYIIEWGGWVLSNLAILLLALESLVSIIPTKKDISIFRTIRSWLDWIGAKLPILGFFFKNNRTGGGNHVAYPKAATTPKFAVNVKEYLTRDQVINQE